MTRILLALLCAAALPAEAAPAKPVAILHDPAAPQQAYAARKLGEALKERGYAVVERSGGDGHVVSLAVRPGRGTEAFRIAREGTHVTVEGGDPRGLIYGALALAESLRAGTPLEAVAATEQKPRLPFRGIKLNTPWDSYRPSSALDQHRATVRDLAYWEAFLDMMVANRFNVLSLWTLHPFTYMVKPASFPEASPWSASARRSAATSARRAAGWRHAGRGWRSITSMKSGGRGPRRATRSSAIAAAGSARPHKVCGTGGTSLSSPIGDSSAASPGSRRETGNGSVSIRISRPPDGPQAPIEPATLPW